MTALPRILQLIGLAALVGSVLPSLLFLAGRMELESMKTAMLAATLAWFVAIPLAGRFAPQSPSAPS